jgi:hypothetical protein
MTFGTLTVGVATVTEGTVTVGVTGVETATVGVLTVVVDAVRSGAVGEVEAVTVGVVTVPDDAVRTGAVEVDTVVVGVVRVLDETVTVGVGEVEAVTVGVVTVPDDTLRTGAVEVDTVAVGVVRVLDETVTVGVGDVEAVTVGVVTVPDEAVTTGVLEDPTLTLGVLTVPPDAVALVVVVFDAVTTVAPPDPLFEPTDTVEVDAPVPLVATSTVVPADGAAVEVPGVEATGAATAVAAVTTGVCVATTSPRTRPPVRVEMAVTGISPPAETLIAVAGALSVVGAGLSASSSILGLTRSTKTVRPPSTIRLIAPSVVETWTTPWITWTALRSFSTTTVKVVPLTTAASIGVSTAKCGTPVCWTLNSIVPSNWNTRVYPAGWGWDGSLSSLAGATMM